MLQHCRTGAVTVLLLLLRHAGLLLSCHKDCMMLCPAGDRAELGLGVEEKGGRHLRGEIIREQLNIINLITFASCKMLCYAGDFAELGLWVDQHHYLYVILSF